MEWDLNFCSLKATKKRRKLHTFLTIYLLLKDTLWRINQVWSGIPLLKRVTSKVNPRWRWTPSWIDLGSDPLPLQSIIIQYIVTACFFHDLSWTYEITDTFCIGKFAVEIGILISGSWMNRFWVWLIECSLTCDHCPISQFGHTCRLHVALLFGFLLWHWVHGTFLWKTFRCMNPQNTSLIMYPPPHDLVHRLQTPLIQLQKIHLNTSFPL